LVPGSTSWSDGFVAHEYIHLSYILLGPATCQSNTKQNSLRQSQCNAGSHVLRQGFSKRSLNHGDVQLKLGFNPLEHHAGVSSLACDRWIAREVQVLSAWVLQVKHTQQQSGILWKSVFTLAVVFPPISDYDFEIPC
jgi:hypothetical protein